MGNKNNRRDEIDDALIITTDTLDNDRREDQISKKRGKNERSGTQDVPVPVCQLLSNLS